MEHENPNVEPSYHHWLNMPGSKPVKKKKKCQYAKRNEAYSWCNLSDNLCVEDSGNENLNEECENKEEADE